MLSDELFRRFMNYSGVRTQNFDEIDFLLLGKMIKMCVNIRSRFHEKIQSRVVIVVDDPFPGSFDFVFLRHNQLKKLGLIYDMVAYVYSCNDVYKYRLAKTRENVLKGHNADLVIDTTVNIKAIPILSKILGCKSNRGNINNCIRTANIKPLPTSITLSNISLVIYFVFKILCLIINMHLFSTISYMKMCCHWCQR